MQPQVLLGYSPITLISKQSFSSLFLTSTLAQPPQEIVIKFFDALFLDKPHEQQQFLEEVAQMQALSHPHILHFSSMGIDQNHPYLIRPYQSTGSLRLHLNEARLPLEQVLEILVQIGNALSYAHAHHLIHGNLKPENILLAKENKPLLVDFHLASLWSKMQEMQVRPNHHTTAYMAPETFQGQRSAKSDQYALGCLAFELITGSVPFPALAFATSFTKHTQETPPSMKSFVPDLPESIETAILKAMDKQPDNRHEDIEKFLQALIGQGEAEVESELAVTSESLSHRDQAPDALKPEESNIQKVATMLLEKRVDSSTKEMMSFPVDKRAELTGPTLIQTGHNRAVQEKKDPITPPSESKLLSSVQMGLFLPVKRSKNTFLRTGAITLVIGILLLSFAFLPRFIQSGHKEEDKTHLTNTTPSGRQIPRHGTSTTPIPPLPVQGAQPTDTTKQSTAVANQPTGTANQPPSSSGPAPTPVPSPPSLPQQPNYFASFEDGGIDNWQPYSPGVQLQVCSTVAEDGSHSLQVNYSPTGEIHGGETYYQTAIQPGATNIALQPGQNVSAYVYIPLGSTQVHTHIFVEDKNYHWYVENYVWLTPGQWQYLSYTIPTGIPTPIQHMGVQFGAVVYGSGTSEPRGTFYIDAVKWS